MFVHIRIEKDNYAYITTGSAKLFNLIVKSYTRETKEYNIYWKRYVNVTKKQYRLVNNRTTIKVKAGTIPFLVSSFSKRDIEYDIEDNRNDFRLDKNDIELQLNAIVKLRDYQEQAVRAAFNNRYCSLQLMTGSGKTEVSASIIKTYLKDSNKAALYVVPTIRLQKEAKERFEKYGIGVSIKPKTIIKGKVNILTYLGLVRSNIDTSYKNAVGLLIFDEAQHLKAAKNSNIVHNFHNLDMCIGLSATLTENIQTKTQLNKLNNDDFGVFGSTGYPVYYKSIEETINDKFVTPIEVHVLLNYDDIKLSRDEMDWHTVKKEVLMSDDRTKYISEYITGVIKENNYNTMCILIPEVKWSQQFMLEFSKHYNDSKLYLTYGSDRYDEIVDGKIIKLDAEEKVKALENIKNPDVKTVFSATSYMYEGIDITNMQALVNVYGGKSSTRVKQQIGRATRLFKDKDKAFIYEICDINNPILKNQFNVRLNIYRKEYKAEIIIDNKE